MRNLLAIARREIRSYLVSPLAYLVVAAFLYLTGRYFLLTLTWMVEYREVPTMRYTVEFMILVFVFAAPLLTMRLLAQEKSTGTLELILTSPVQDWELVLGKFLAGLALYLMMIVPTLAYPLTMEVFGNPDWGPVWSGYLGLLMLGGVLLAVGLFTSALTESQVVAAVLGMAGNLLLWFYIGAAAASPDVNPRMAGLLRILDLGEHLQTFVSGAMDTRDIVYCVSLMAFFLFGTTRVLEVRRWRA